MCVAVLSAMESQKTHAAARLPVDSQAETREATLYLNAIAEP